MRCWSASATFGRVNGGCICESENSSRKQVFLKDWQVKLDEFLHFNDREVLPNSGAVSKKEADAQAALEYECFKQRRRAMLEDSGASDNIDRLEDLSKNPPT
ncbi:Unannotated [Lentimonas sp. CC19]|nr:Unannotated [Lentimonas sp. CC19]CAA6693287.1 Unannotated [Lentimonas sp. CC10]CAA7071778.1 Unannotated [Lentimonas sp. CC11]